MAAVHMQTQLPQYLVVGLDLSVLLVEAASLVPCPPWPTSRVSVHMPSHQQPIAAVVQME
jgi:hypothetical protein